MSSTQADLEVNNSIVVRQVPEQDPVSRAQVVPTQLSLHWCSQLAPHLPSIHGDPDTPTSSAVTSA